ncbi:MAG TPA: imidazole glycerol phosphate synthase subunit HisH [Candidatus Brocadiia bacterium]|nr:imidazole glycerol phosphate synthase subunit HisH [Candidatus Brocadiia bacterium]
MIAIVDCGIGNLRSVKNAFDLLKADAFITSDPEAARKADKIVLPGVGAFEDAMNGLRSRGLLDAVLESARGGKPYLGICLGMQILLDSSQEGGFHEGLGLIGGEVVRFDVDRGEPRLKVPHMGWNQVEVVRPAPIFKGLEGDHFFYFVHSFYASPRNRDVVAGSTEYGHPFASAIWRDNVFATQFHPEKSQKNGLRMLRNFIEL